MKRITKEEIQRRLEQGRLIRLDLERKNISYDELMKQFRLSRNSISLALRSINMPTLRNGIERYVAKKPVSKAA